MSPPTEPPMTATREVVVVPGAQAQILMGALAPSLTDPDHPPLKVLTAVLGGGMASRFFSELRDQQALAYTTLAQYPARVDTSAFVAILGTAPENVPKAEPALTQQLGSALRGGEESQGLLGLVQSPAQKEISGVEDLFETNFIATCSAMLRRKALGELPSWYATCVWEDWPLYILYAERGKIGYLNEVMAVYRNHGRGLWSGLGPVEQLEAVIRFLQDIDERLGHRYQRPIAASLAKYRAHLRAARGEDSLPPFPRTCGETVKR